MQDVRTFGGLYFVDLNNDEIAMLVRPVRGSGVFETFIRRLQSRVNYESGTIRLTQEDIETIPQLAFDHGDSSFECRLSGIFRRTLGATLGRPAEI